MINVESHGFSCHLGIIAFAIGKIALASLVQLPYLLLMQLFPNRTQIHVFTHTKVFHACNIESIILPMLECNSIYESCTHYEYCQLKRDNMKRKKRQVNT